MAPWLLAGELALPLIRSSTSSVDESPSSTPRTSAAAAMATATQSYIVGEDTQSQFVLGEERDSEGTFDLDFDTATATNDTATNALEGEV